MPLQTGQVLEQRYRIEALLGQGGMGAVYRAVDLKFNTPVALKENLTVTPDSQRQFTREAGLLHQLRHPNLPRVTDHFTIAGQGQYLVMDYVEGEDLKGLLVRQGPLPEAQALNWICQVLDALEYLHSRQVIHRDVKPANVKITPQGQVFLVDFGLAKVYDPGQETTIGARGATPGYAPPEQYGQGRTDARSDVYSAGATLYSLVSGQVPPDALDMVIRRGKLPSLRQLAPGMSPHVEAAVTRAMQTVPEDRFQTSAEFRQALHEPPTRVLPPRRMEPVRDEPAPAAKPPPHARPSPQVDTHQRIAALLAGARTALDRQDWDGAEAGCEAALALDSQHVGARQLLGKVRTAQQLDSHYARAVAAMQAGDWEAATSALEQVTVLDAGYRDAQALLQRAEAERHRPAPPPPAPSGPRPPGFAERAGEALSGLREHVPAPTARFLLISMLVVVALLIIVPSIFLLLGNGGEPELAVEPTVEPAVEPAGGASLEVGEGILFSSNRDGKKEVYRLQAGQAERLTDTPGRSESWSPSWSDTGVLFTSNQAGKREIYRLVDGPPERVSQTPGDGESWGPVFTETGILFTSTRDGKRDIYRLRGGQTERVTHTAGDGESWGPVQTDTGMLFTSNRDGKREIYRLRGGQTERITHTAGDGESWGPVQTDTGILFVSTRDGQMEIYRLSGGQTERVTQTSGGESWGPVSTETGILFTSTRDGKREIYRLHAGKAERVTQTPGDWESWTLDPEE
jgi:Tol biopolymer transport system component